MFQALAGSDVGELSFGSPINTSALLIILLHQVLESHTLVRDTLTLQDFRNDILSNCPYCFAIRIIIFILFLFFSLITVMHVILGYQKNIVWREYVGCKYNHSEEELSLIKPKHSEATVCPNMCFVLQTWIHVVVLVLSGAFYFGFVLLFSVVCATCSPPTNPVGVETLQMSQPLFYIICALTTVTALLPRCTQVQSNNNTVFKYCINRIQYSVFSHPIMWFCTAGKNI